MPRDRDSSGERSSAKYGGASYGRLSDEAIARSLLDPEERRRQAQDKPWWARMIDWWREMIRSSD